MEISEAQQQEPPYKAADPVRRHVCVCIAKDLGSSAAATLACHGCEMFRSSSLHMFSPAYFQIFSSGSFSILPRDPAAVIPVRLLSSHRCIVKAGNT